MKLSFAVKRKNKIKIASFHYLCFISNERSLAECGTSVLWQRYPWPPPSRVPLHVKSESSAGQSPKGAFLKVKAVRFKVRREHFKSESSPRGVKARSQGSIAKVKAQSRQVPREHCNVIERSLDCRIRIKLTIEFFTIDSLSFDI